MKSKLTTVLVVAAAHLLLFCISVGILKASGFALFTPASPMQEFLFGFVVILSYPMPWVADFFSLPDNLFTMLSGLLLNSVIWGVCIGAVLFRFVRPPLPAPKVS